MKLKLDKSAGPDGLTNECIKTARNLLLTPLTILWNKILEEEAVPSQWTESEIILLYKKGDPADIGNYRPISLMPCLYKLFASCLLERISPDIDSYQPIEQAGFRSGFSTVDHIQVVDQKASAKVGLEMNLDKTKVMTNHHISPILVNDIPLEF
ncbi:PREDICTED: RNA-directed DNA polymerase from mobile element jockey-like, partial [Papilio polytes]|uniref:RNA-directed DNA polymerase from mobile element jockey-like n=1 Tax=Papilio polytes TaxID=76194 RepID=UPI0006768B43